MSVDLVKGMQNVDYSSVLRQALKVVIQGNAEELEQTMGLNRGQMESFTKFVEKEPSLLGELLLTMEDN